MSCTFIINSSNHSVLRETVHSRRKRETGLSQLGVCKIEQCTPKQSLIKHADKLFLAYPINQTPLSHILINHLAGLYGVLSNLKFE